MELINGFRRRSTGRVWGMIALVTAVFLAGLAVVVPAPPASGRAAGPVFAAAPAGLGIPGEYRPPPAPPPRTGERPPSVGGRRLAERVRAELMAVVEPATALGSTPAVPQGRLSWPLSPVPVVTKYFDAPETPYGAGHRGVDLAAVPGQEVLAADAGVVVFAGLVGGRPVMSVDHDGGLRTTYEPVEPKVAVGEQVYRGQVLGTVLAGHPGCAIAACLHWGVRRGDEYVDPLALTGELGEFRLKPWGGGP